LKGDQITLIWVEKNLVQFGHLFKEKIVFQIWSTFFFAGLPFNCLRKNGHCRRSIIVLTKKNWLANWGKNVLLNLVTLLAILPDRER
jgi:hypothetical protein